MAIGQRLASHLIRETRGQALVMVEARIVVARGREIDEAVERMSHERKSPEAQVPRGGLDIHVF